MCIFDVPMDKFEVSQSQCFFCPSSIYEAQKQKLCCCCYGRSCWNGCVAQEKCLHMKLKEKKTKKQKQPKHTSSFLSY